MAEPPIDVEDRDAWFVREVLPHEGALMRFLRRNWRDAEEAADLRQEVYARVYEAAGRAGPRQVKPFLFMTARNLLIDKARRARIVSIETVSDLETLNVANEDVAADETVIARQELRRLQVEIDRLPTRCREVVLLRKVEGLSQREVARRMGIAEDTVERQVANGVKALADALFGGRDAARLALGGGRRLKGRGA
jgi:RNA polymerase sigma factor (sigma-70 family)